MKNGKFQVHCDFGWYGKSNGWYNLWDAILDFNSGSKKMVEYIPLEGEELKAWKPARVSDPDTARISNADTKTNISIEEIKSAGKLPQKFDPRTLRKNYLTPIKDQSPWSACWAFSAMDSIQIYAKMNGLQNYDLSARNMYAPLGYLNKQGFIGYKITAMYLLSHRGPILESQDPYSSKIKPTVDNALKEKIPPALFVDQSRTFPGKKSKDYNQNQIKQAILDYGAVIAHDYQKDKFLSTSDATFYNGSDNATNHAITLVGWDDNKVVTGGSGSTTCPGIGAWIVKNSFGTDYGEDGYFYLSYHDLTGVSAMCYCFPSIVPYDENIHLYEYDELGQNGLWYSKSNASYALIKFTTSGKSQYLTKLGTYATTANTNLGFTVYKTKSGNTLSNQITSIPDQACKVAGYYSFDVPEPILLEANTSYFVKIRYESSSRSRVPTEKSTDKIKATLEADKCWVSSDGETWLSVGKNVPEQQFDICAKFYTYSGNKANIKNSGANNAAINPTTLVK